MMDINDRIRMVADGLKVQGKFIDDEITQICRDLRGARYALDMVTQERDEALAKLAAMESQEPAVHITPGGTVTYAINYEGPLGAEFYSKPVPADKPAVADNLCKKVSIWYARLTGADPVTDEDEHVGYCCTMKMMDEMEDILASAPSHSQQSADKGMLGSLADKLAEQGVESFNIAGVNYRCPSHESEQPTLDGRD